MYFDLKQLSANESSLLNKYQITTYHRATFMSCLLTLLLFNKALFLLALHVSSGGSSLALRGLRSHPRRLQIVQLFPCPRGLQQNELREWESNLCPKASIRSLIFFNFGELQEHRVFALLKGEPHMQAKKTQHQWGPHFWKLRRRPPHDRGLHMTKGRGTEFYILGKLR